MKNQVPEGKGEVNRLHRTGVSLFVAEEYDKAAKIFTGLLREHIGHVYRPDIDMWLGVCHLWRGDFDRAKTHLLRARDEVDRENEGLCCLQVLQNLSSLFHTHGQPSEAMGYLEEAEPFFHLYSGEESRWHRSDFRLLKGRLYLCLAEYQRALLELTEAKAQVPEQEWSDGLETLFAYEIGRTHHYLGDEELARKYLQSIDPDKFDDRDLVADYHYIMARLGISIKEYESTLKHFEMLKSFDVSDKDRAVVLCYAGIAHMYLGHREDAIECFKASQRTLGKSDALRETNASYLAKLLRD